MAAEARTDEEQIRINAMEDGNKLNHDAYVVRVETEYVTASSTQHSFIIVNK